MRKTLMDDGFQAYLTEGARRVGDPGIPMLMDLDNTQIPKSLVPFDKAKTTKDKRQYVHFYSHDITFARVLTSTCRYLDLMKQFDGIITPDCSILIGQSRCLQQTNTYMNRAVGFYFQKNGIPVIPNIRWGDESTYDFSFLGVPQNSIVSISTHGCIKHPELRRIFKDGLGVMLDIIKPRDVLVHGYMPDSVFADYKTKTRFHRYASEFESTHQKGGV